MPEGDVNIEGELALVLEALEARHASYALCGGLAVAVHGFTRATTDIDLVVLRKDLESVKAAIREAGFFIDNGLIPLPSQGIEFYRMAKIVASEVLPIDLLFVEESSSLWKTRERRNWKAREIWVLSARGLIEMKSKSERTKDKLDIEELLKIENGG